MGDNSNLLYLINQLKKPFFKPTYSYSSLDYGSATEINGHVYPINWKDKKLPVSLTYVDIGGIFMDIIHCYKNEEYFRLELSNRIITFVRLLEENRLEIISYDRSTIIRLTFDHTTNIKKFNFITDLNMNNIDNYSIIYKDYKEIGEEFMSLLCSYDVNNFKLFEKNIIEYISNFIYLYSIGKIKVSDTTLYSYIY